MNEAIVSGNVTAWHWWLNGINNDNEGRIGKRATSS